MMVPRICCRLVLSYYIEINKKSLHELVRYTLPVSECCASIASLCRIRKTNLTKVFGVNLHTMEVSLSTSAILSTDLGGAMVFTVRRQYVHSSLIYFD